MIADRDDIEWNLGIYKKIKSMFDTYFGKTLVQEEKWPP